MDGRNVNQAAKPVSDVLVFGVRNVRSSAVADIMYMPELNTLEVTFRSGGVYHYENFPVAEWNKLMEAHAAGESIGRYFAAHIRAVFPSRKITLED